MRIAVTGAHRVGKTTLAEAIAEYLPGYDYHDEPYRQLEETGFLFSDIPTIDDYLAQFNHRVEQIEDSGKDVIFDRCPLDILAYIYTLGKIKDLNKLYAEMANSLSQIDLLIFVPIESPDLMELLNTELPILRLEVNEILQNWIPDLSNDILTVRGSIESRKKQIFNKLQNIHTGIM